MKYLYTFLFIGFSFFSFAQQGFIEHYTLDYPTTTFTGMLLDNDTLIITSIVYDEELNQFGYNFTKLDTFGNVIHQNLLTDNTGKNYSLLNLPMGLLKVSDNSGYILLGHITELKTGLVIKVNKSGEKIWSKYFHDSSSQQEFYRKIIEVEDGFLIVAHKQRLDYWIDGFIMKIDHQGNKIWQKYYGENNWRNDWLDNIVMLNNNEFSLGQYTAPEIGTPNEDLYISTKIFAIDSLGNELWSWESELGREEMDMDGLHRDNDGNWVYATHRAELHPSGGFLKQTKFIKRDGDFNLLEEKTYDDLDGTTNYFYNMTRLSNGEYLGIGSNYEIIDNPNQFESHIYSWLVRANLNGDSLWTGNYKLFPDSTSHTKHYLHSAVELPSGNLIAAGYFSSWFTNNLGILLKVDCEGNIDTLLACEGFSTAIPHVAEMDVGLKVWPNPANSILHFESPVIPVWERAELLDMTGRAVQSTNYNNQMTLEGVPSGMYVLQLWQHGERWARQVVITK